MTTDFVYPSAIDLKEIEQDLLPRLQADRPIFSFFPIEESDDSVVAWEQEDNYLGLQQLRGLDGAPVKVARTGGKRYVMDPGTYGEFSVIPESEMTRRRPYGQLTAAIDLTEPVAKEQIRLLQRRLDRVELIGWTLVVNGQFSVALPTGGIGHTDAYTVQTYAAATTWATAATSTPLLDFRKVKLLARGHSVRFDQTAVAYANAKTLNNLYANTNNADLYGRRTAGLGTFNSPDQINQLFMGDGLPQLHEYDLGYLDDTATFQPFIPDNKVVVIGNRTNGSPVGRYLMTRNANNPGMAPGAYTRVFDRGETQVPRVIEVHDGHNGGPSLSFPSAIVVMSV